MRNFLIKIIYLIELYFIIVAMFSCSMETYSVKKTYADNQIMSYVSENHYNVSADSLGLVYIPITEGNGHYPHHGDIVAFHYIGYFLNGEKFDSSYDRSYPLVVELGKDNIIKGLEHTIMKMDKGAKSKVIIPFYMAYDDMENAPVPPFSNLVFELELLDIDKK